MASVSLGTALVTGASSGIGAAYADRLAARGHDLILVARRRERLSDLATSITDRTGRAVQVVGADLGTSEGQREVEALLHNDASITVLVNNAGVGAVGPLVQNDADQMEALIDLDVTALMRLTYAAAARFAERGRGTIVNISSIVAIHPELLNGVYGGAKAFVLAFSKSLHHELTDKGVQIQAVLPGGVATDFWPNLGVQHADLPAGILMSVDDVVDAALAGLDAGELVTIPSLPDAEKWEAYEGARCAMIPDLSRATPAVRYRHPAAANA